MTLRSSLLILGALLVSFVLLYRFAFVGYLGSDDLSYLAMVDQWRFSFPAVPALHWDTRHPFILTIVAITSLFGESEATVVAAPFLWLVCLFVLYMHVARMTAEPLAVYFAAFFFVFLPIVYEMSSVIVPGATEATFVFASFIVFWTYRKSTAALVPMLAAGVLAGLAFTTRETAAGLVAFYAAAFLFNLFTARPRYFLVGGGFIFVLLVEALYYASIGQSPLLRFEILMSLGASDFATSVGTGNLTSSPVFGPILALFLNNEFAILYYVAAFALVYLFRQKTGAQVKEQLWFALGLLGLAWFVVLGYGLGVRALPRYFHVTTITMLLVSSVAFARMYANGGNKVFVAVVLAAYCGASLLVLDLTNKQPRFSLRAVVQVAADNPATPIWTDPATYARLGRLLSWNDISPEQINRVRPREESLFVYFPPTVDSGVIFGQTFETDDYRPNENWDIHARVTSEKTRVGDLLSLMGITPSSAGLPQRLYAANPDVVVYKVPALDER